jgi:general secretion pathway protein K
MSTNSSSGVALLMVLWTLAILSAIALTLAASVSTEVRASQDLWGELQAERLAKSGQEVAAYLETRSIGAVGEDLTALPIQPIISGLRYQLTLPAGTVDISLEGENGKLDLGSFTEEDLAASFAVWTGDTARGREIAASIADWIDVDDQARPLGAESAWYASQGYAPRNSSLGAADLLLIKGLRPEDFRPSVMPSTNGSNVRGPLQRIFSAIPTGGTVNPNYAPATVIDSLPGITQAIAARILEVRQQSMFRSAQELAQQVGLAPDDPVLRRFTFSRGSAPTIVSSARVSGFPGTRIERRTRTQIMDRRRGVPVRFVSFIEH